MHNAALSADGTKVICDFGIYTLTGQEIASPDLRAAAEKCKAAYDSEWFQRKRWDEPLTAETQFD